LNIAWHQGNTRSATFDIQTSDNATDWSTVYSGVSSGTTTALEPYDVTDSVRRYVRIVGHGNSQNLWNSISEVQIYSTSPAVVVPAPRRDLLISAVKVANGQRVTLQWTNQADTISQVQASSDLRGWANVGTEITDSGVRTWQETVAANSRFYRIKKTPKPIAPLPPPGDALLPSQVLDLTNWKLTLPVDTSHAGSPDEYKQPELATYQHPTYFHTNGTRDGVVFRAHCGGYTTSGSGYPRSELREMTSNGSANASWSTTSGTHTMEIRQMVTHLPVVKPHVVVGQIHDAADDVIVFRLEGTKLFVDQNGVNGPVLTSNYQLGTVFTVKFVARNGGVECYYNGQYIYTYKVSTSGCYFKAGCYTQSNTSKGDSASAYGEVVIFDVKVNHQ
jgi:hypothetical protein